MSKSTIPNDQWQPWQLRELNQWDLNSGIPALSDVPEPDAPKSHALNQKKC
ncbi:hypothetical protein LHK12_06400 [Providencia rettgeri]|nr:hypothetical protein [Providencia rettgeri]